MTSEIRRFILLIRDTGETNMFDYPVVLRIAEREEYTELADWLPTHKVEYANFIMYGDPK
ncbi:hypothetical protein FACS18948_3980 [Clostridia bacterium]|nr:hypothetical protein FACS1894184_03220 [Clostridia bacterium]GHV27124.1 hypothetical protein FACS18948_3980 [Clostridia bacterium]